MLLSQRQDHDTAHDQGRRHRICSPPQELANAIVQQACPIRGVTAGREQCAGDAVAQELCVDVGAEEREQGMGHIEAVVVGGDVEDGLSHDAVDCSAC